MAGKIEYRYGGAIHKLERIPWGRGCDEAVHNHVVEFELSWSRVNFKPTEWPDWGRHGSEEPN